MQLDRQNTEALGKIIKSGALQCDLNALHEVLTFYQKKCQLSKDDDETTKVFKLFIVWGTILKVSQITKLKQTQISDILFFKRCDDLELTLMGKYIYSISGTKYHEFLKWQVEVLFTTGMLDVKKEYIKWKKFVYKEPIENGKITIADIEKAADSIDFK